MRWLKVGGVIFGALVITTLGISASDALTGNSGSLLGQLAGDAATTGCPNDMAPIATAGTFSCVDRYEVSAVPTCPVAAPGSVVETQQNLNERTCSGNAVSGAVPWTAITREQAQAVCLRAGKRLPTAAEWYHVAIGTPDDAASCNLDSHSLKPAGAFALCVSSAEVYDMVGNAWEWVSDDVIDGQYQGRSLPAEGYVTQVASDGVPTATASDEDELFGKDYLWTSDTGAYAMLRGGYFDSKNDGGIYTIQAKTLPTLATGAIGFRCVR